MTLKKPYYCQWAIGDGTNCGESDPLMFDGVSKSRCHRHRMEAESGARQRQDDRNKNREAKPLSQSARDMASGIWGKPTNDFPARVGYYGRGVVLSDSIT